MMPASRFLAPLVNLLGFLPHLDVMSHSQLRQTMEKAGFVVEHEWLPNKKAAVFIIARKP